MGIFSRSKKPPTSPPPPPKQITTPYPQLAPQHAVYQVPYGPQPPYNYQNASEPPNLAHGRSQSFPPPQGWGMNPPPYQPFQQVFVSNFLLSAPQPIQQQSTGKTSSNGKKGKNSSNRLNSASVGNLALPRMLQGDMPSFIPGAHFFNEGSNAWQQQLQGTQLLSQGTTLYDLISNKFDAVITGIDGERFSGDERELFVHPPPPMLQQQEPQWQGPYNAEKDGVVAMRAIGFGNGKEKKEKSKIKTDTGCPITNSLVSTNYFAKVNLYANSKLPPNLPAVKLYIPTFPLLCIAAQYSERVYTRPTGSEREAHVDSDWRLGTKAMVIKSIPMDSADVLVFAIRGSQTFLDWAVNLNSAPSTPTNFLDDPGNLCHAGFLSVARKMVKPVAARLRHLLEEDPRRSKCSLLITGHSAGGAVAALLYMHMLSTSRETQSELNVLTGCFRRIHCITFGAPPVSLLPLQKPSNPATRKSLFLSFVNEGDPVTRADKAYVRSLLDLYSSSAPSTTKPIPASNPVGLNPTASKSRLLLLPSSKASKSTTSLIPTPTKPPLPPRSKSNPAAPLPTWPVPPSTLSNAGRLILLRGVPLQGKGGKEGKAAKVTMDDGVQARGITDQDLRGVVFGDPVCHMMRLYARRVEVLATNAVVGRA